MSPVASASRKPAAVFSALGDETRLAIVNELADGSPRSIARLTGSSSITRQAITKHLRVLQGAGLVRGEREGRETLFRLVPGPLEEAQEYLGRVSAQWDGALSRLRAHVER